MINSSRIVSGVVAGTGAQISVACGGIPAGVRLFNTSGLAKLEWNNSMAAGGGIKTITNGTMSYITSGGITAGTVNTLRGFYIGLDTDINQSGENIAYEAWW